ncbi:hypothetical protein NFI96_025717 [Prochilodus magdalenae]|nr:hypothetical protein NFI96_025717 [Prochilodus magdalenae]
MIIIILSSLHLRHTIISSLHLRHIIIIIIIISSLHLRHIIIIIVILSSLHLRHTIIIIVILSSLHLYYSFHPFQEPHFEFLREPQAQFYHPTVSSMKKEQVVNCQFSVWYPLFKKHTIKSLILPLPQNVIEYLLDDGTLVVSGSSENSHQRSQTNNSDSEGEEDIQWSDDETTTVATVSVIPNLVIRDSRAVYRQRYG